MTVTKRLDHTLDVVTDPTWLAGFDALALGDGLCEICGQKPSGPPSKLGTPRGLVVDHNHKTGEDRGLLCNACNSGLGFFRDNVELLRAAIRYLEERGTYAT